MYLARSIDAHRPTGSVQFMGKSRRDPLRPGPKREKPARPTGVSQLGTCSDICALWPGFAVLLAGAAPHSCYAQLDHAPFGKLVSSDKRLFVYTARSKGHIFRQMTILFVRI